MWIVFVIWLFIMLCKNVEYAYLLGFSLFTATAMVSIGLFNMCFSGKLENLKILIYNSSFGSLYSRFVWLNPAP